MHGYLSSVEGVVNAVVRGDLHGARETAATLASAPPPVALPDAMTRHALALTTAARQAAAAPSVTHAAVSVGRALAACGACHRATGASPSLIGPHTPVILTGTAAHMVAHRHAVDRLMRGLFVPSDREWRDGARALSAAPLHARGVPRDPPLAPGDLRIEEAIHRLATEAAEAVAIDNRIRVFSTLLARCGDCHARLDHPPR
jgi:mono/diheme cytochrome c family protein